MEKLIEYDNWVKPETADLAKRKGFDIYCPNSLIKECTPNGDVKYTNTASNYTNGNSIYRPTLALIQEWLIEKHNIQVYAKSHTKNGKKWIDWVAYVDNREINDARDQEYQSYNAALEFGLVTALNQLESVVVLDEGDFLTPTASNNEIEKLKYKAEQWDKLGEQIEKCYVNVNGEFDEDNPEEEGSDLGTIGELAAIAYGWL